MLSCLHHVLISGSSAVHAMAGPRYSEDEFQGWVEAWVVDELTRKGKGHLVKGHGKGKDVEMRGVVWQEGGKGGGGAAAGPKGGAHAGSLGGKGEGGLPVPGGGKGDGGKDAHNAVPGNAEGAPPGVHAKADVGGVRAKADGGAPDGGLAKAEGGGPGGVGGKGEAGAQDVKGGGKGDALSAPMGSTVWHGKGQGKVQQMPRAPPIRGSAGASPAATAAAASLAAAEVAAPVMTPKVKTKARPAGEACGAIASGLFAY